MLVLKWTFARSLGELQVLTRASYALLVIVPLLAGAWPIVRVQVARHAEILVNASNNLSKTLQNLRQDARARLQGEDDDQRTIEVRIRNYEAAVTHAQSEVSRTSGDVQRGATLSPNLSSGWVLGFFAALCATLAHAAYQIGAPEIVKQGSRKAYIRNRRSEFASNFTVGDIEIAKHKLDKIKAADNEKPDADRFLTREEDMRLTGADSFVKDLLDFKTGVTIQENLGCALDIIDVHSRVTYDEEAIYNQLACAIATIFYGLALLLIASVTAGQVRNVLEAGGYL